MRDKQPSLDDLSVDRPPRRAGSADSFPVFTDAQAEAIYKILKEQDAALSVIEERGEVQDKTLKEISDNVLKVVDRDADQEKTLGELKEFKAQILKESSSKAGRWSAIGTVLGVIIASAAATAMQQCRWVPPGAVQQIQQTTPTPK